MLSGMDNSGLILTLIVYMLMIPLWNFLAFCTTWIPAVARGIEKYQRILVPVVFIGLGLLILLNPA